MASSTVARSVEEVEHAKKECLALLEKLREFCPISIGDQYPDTYRLLVTPMLYSAWERCFTLCHAIGLRLLREFAANPQALTPSARAVWLIQTPFFQSLVSRLQIQTALQEERRPKRGQFSALCEFLLSFERWLTDGIDPAIATDELVMTFSNVNQEVVEMNASAIGIAEFPRFKEIKFGRLHDLVGRRNEIGHGAIISAPPNENFVELWDFTERLIHSYCDAFIAWTLSTFTEEDLGENLSP
jgi:hypothetical protein